MVDSTQARKDRELGPFVRTTILPSGCQGSIVVVDGSTTRVQVPGLEAKEVLEDRRGLESARVE